MKLMLRGEEYVSMKLWVLHAWACTGACEAQIPVNLQAELFEVGMDVQFELQWLVHEDSK